MEAVRSIDTEFFFHLGQHNEAGELVLRHHYLHTLPQSMMVVGSLHRQGGLFGDLGPMVAACVFTRPQARWSEDLLELVRLIRLPDVSVNLTSLIAQTVNHCRRTGFDLLISYADIAAGHHGGIYQAASWKYHGERIPEKTIIVNGQKLHRRTCNQRFGTSSPTKIFDMVEGTVVPHYDEGKHLYWRPLSRTGKRKADRLKFEDNPYPKPNE